MNKEELEEYLIQIVVPDIMQCMNENSKHNQQGEYGFEYNGKKLQIKFQWNNIHLDKG